MTTTPELIAAETLAQDEFDQAESLLVSLLRDAYPTLDLRRGTALRDLLVRPTSAAYALDARRNNELMRTRSLADMAAQPGDSDTDAVNAVLANFGTALRQGFSATGTIKINVNTVGTYRIAAGTLFQAPGSEDAYSVISDVVARQADGTLRGPDESGYLYFTVPVVATTAASTVPSAGTAFDAAVPFSGYVAAAAYSDFVPGRPDETVSEAIGRLPATLSGRGLVTRASITNTFTDPASAGYVSSVRALSVQGAGDPAQQRDRNNIHGLSLGGKVDVYARTFSTPPSVVLLKQGTLQTDGTYRIDIAPSDAPGLYAVKSVTLDPAAIGGGRYADDAVVHAGSLDFAVQRYDDTADAPAGRFSSGDSTIGTIYHGARLYVAGGQPDDSAPTFRVDLYASPDIGLMQAYADLPEVRNMASDLLVRSPFICLVGLRLTVRPAADATLDIAAIKDSVAAVVNANSFYGALTQSELIAAVHRYPVISVDTTCGRRGGVELAGTVIDGSGAAHTLSGARLDIADVDDPTGLLRRETVVFATEPARISIEVVTP